MTGVGDIGFMRPNKQGAVKMPRAQARRVTENEIAFAACQIAAAQTNGVATFHRMKREIPNYVQLSPADRAQSQTRPNEELWEQLIRNIKSHSESEGNYIYEGYLNHVPRVGYEITPAGRRHVQGGVP